MTLKEETRALSRQIKELRKVVRENKAQLDRLVCRHRELLKANLPHQIRLTKKRIARTEEQMAKYNHESDSWLGHRLKEMKETLVKLEADLAMEKMIGKAV